MDWPYFYAHSENITTLGVWTWKQEKIIQKRTHAHNTLWPFASNQNICSRENTGCKNKLGKGKSLKHFGVLRVGYLCCKTKHLFEVSLCNCLFVLRTEMILLYSIINNSIVFVHVHYLCQEKKKLLSILLGRET